MARQKFTQAQVTNALRECKGMVAVAARRLGCDRVTVNRYLARYPEIRQTIEDEREAMTDMAELALYKAIQSGEAWAVCFYLKTQGKGRGYVERQEITGADGGAIAVEAAPARERLRAKVTELARRLPTPAEEASGAGAA